MLVVIDESGESRCAMFVDPILGSTGRAKENKTNLQLE
jgi:hypothetical protein